jgi:hypothetical protein
MEAKQAIALAKDYVAEVYSGEQLSNVGLEEVDFDDRREAWDITIGFSRPWNNAPALMPFTAAENYQRRTYKVIKISDKSGDVLSMKNRDVEPVN